MNYYELLGVKEGASKKAIHAAYKTLVKRLSLGVLDEEKQDAARLMRIIQDAYASLSGGNLDTSDSEVPVSSHEEMIIRNLQNNKYQVTIPRRSVIKFPNTCVCCMTEDPRKQYKIKANKYFVLYGEKLSTNAPICDECNQHNTQAQRLFYLLTIGPAVVAAILTSILTPDRFSHGFSIYTLLIPMFSLVFFFISALLIQFKRYPLPHASHNMPVRIRRYSSKSVAFDFENYSSANAFAQANDGTLKVKHQRNHSISRRFLFGYYPLDSVFVFLVLWMLIAAFLSTMF